MKERYRLGGGGIFYSAGRFISQVVLLLVLLIVAGEGVGLHGTDAAEVLVGIKGVGLQLYDGHGDVGAVVGHALVVGQEVVEHKALVQGTGTGLGDGPHGGTSSHRTDRR